MITLITGNSNKFKEIQAILGDVLVQKDIDLPEIQSLNVEDVITRKLQDARTHIPTGAILVDDSGYYFKALGRLPGVFSKYFLEELGLSGNVALLEKLGDMHALAYTVLGYMDEHNEVQYFRGEVLGTIVNPSGNGGFGFDPIFLPDGHTLTVAAMSEGERINFKMRTVAAQKLKAHLAK